MPSPGVNGNYLPIWRGVFVTNGVIRCRRSVLRLGAATAQPQERSPRGGDMGGGADRFAETPTRPRLARSRAGREERGSAALARWKSPLPPAALALE
jgi:hypothetical protein